VVWATLLPALSTRRGASASHGCWKPVAINPWPAVWHPRRWRCNGSSALL